MGNSIKQIAALVVALSCWAICAVAQTPLKTSIAKGKLVYNQYCLSCHQADGGGVPNMNPPLARSAWVTGDKKVLINILLNGFNQKVEIDGDYYSNTMPPQNSLTDQQIADVLTFVRNNFGNKAPAISAANVKMYRKFRR